MPKKSKKPANHATNTSIYKTACKRNSVCISVTTRYGTRSGCCTIKEAARLCLRSEATIRRWLRNQTISDQASAQLLAIYVAGVMPWHAFEGFSINDEGKLIDTIGRSHTASEIQERGHYWSENKRLRAIIDNLKVQIAQRNQESKERPVRIKPTLRLVK
ncbi:hypothetical protein [Endozoicomonas sp.]|uniref:hypothetical protein n=1 Tax=Endozoicomonas sp. TaxID=1892382 RepID=UPI003AF4A4BA